MCMILAKKFMIIITVFGHNFMKNNFFSASFGPARGVQKEVPI